MDMHWHLPADLLTASVQIMRPHGALGHEGLALWYGQVQHNYTAITHVVAVHGPGFRSGPLQLQLSLRAMEKLTLLTEQLGAHLVGQIHSHPGVFLDLSLADITYGIRRQDYLSLVCPHYAQRDIASVHECGVHVFDHGAYRRLQSTEIAVRLVASSDHVNVIACEVPA